MSSTPTTPERASQGFVRDLTRHPPGFWFLFWGEFAERCSFYGMRAILVTFLIDRHGFEPKEAKQYYFLFLSLCYLLPLVGGWLADNVLGKYWTIVGFSLPYILGHFILGIEEPGYLIAALLLLATGTGVTKPNISTLLGLTYDQQRRGETKLRYDAFQMFYMAINIGAALSQLVVPYIKDRFSYQWAFLFPAALMVVALILFAAGKRLYAVETIGPVELSPEDRRARWALLGRIAGLFLLVAFFWAIFDQTGGPWIDFARVYMTGPLIDIGGLRLDMSAEQMQSFNPVFIVALTPIMMYMWHRLDASGVRVRATDKMVLGFALTAVTMAIMAVAAYLAPAARPSLRVALQSGAVVLPAPEDALKEHGSKDGDVAGLSLSHEGHTLRVDKGEFRGGKLSFTDGTVEGPGYRLVIRNGAPDFAASEGVAGPGQSGGHAGLESSFKPADSAGETPRVNVVPDSFVPQNQRVSLWWQAVAYFILTVAELLISVTGLEMAYSAAPKSLSGFVTACWLLTVFIGNFALNLPLTMLEPLLTPGNYFAFLAGVMVVVALVFVWVAARFNRALDAAHRAGSEAA